jgi:hypothetical protein
VIAADLHRGRAAIGGHRAVQGGAHERCAAQVGIAPIDLLEAGIGQFRADELKVRIRSAWQS